MRFGTALTCLVFALIPLSAGVVFCADTTPLEALQFTDGDHIIQSFILVADEESLRYNVIASCDAGVTGIDLLAGAETMFTQPCEKKSACRLNGASPVAKLKTNVVTARAECADGLSQKESVRLNIGGKNPKVYLVAALPYFIGQLAPPTGSGPVEGTGQPQIERTPPKPPTLTVETKKEGENTYLVTATAVDESGLDFVEILREKVFMDVQLCRKQTTCTLEKTITETTPGDVKFQFKAMDLDGALSIDQVVLSFTAPANAPEEKNTGENRETPKPAEPSAP